MIKKLLMTFLLMASSAQASAPANHLFFASDWLYRHGVSDFSCRRSFFLGTLFPDIRYLGTIKRSRTHRKEVSPDEIERAGSYFKAGMLLHSFVDVEREKFAKRYKVYDHLSFIPKKQRQFFLKLLEDEIIWDMVDLSRIHAILAYVDEEEITAGVEEEVVEMWHGAMASYFAQRPSCLLTELAERREGFVKASAGDVANWQVLLPRLASEPYFILYAERLLAHLKHLINPKDM